MRKAKIYQIFYDDATRKKVMPGFIALDNTANERPDWFEFWVILHYLRTNKLDEDTLYGFISPKFLEKTGISSISVLSTIAEAPEDIDVFLFSAAWEQICYFLNPWEQAEAWHPGLTDISQTLIKQCGLDVDLRTMVTDSTCTVLSNYVIASARFWRAWQWFAERFFLLAEHGNSETDAYRSGTPYGSMSNPYPIKTFIQERFSSLVLAIGEFNVYAADRSSSGQIHTRLFQDDQRTRRMLQTCDILKLRYRETGDQDYLNMYWKVRQNIKYTPPEL